MQKFGETVVNRITPEMDRGYAAERKKGGVANKTVNLEVGVLTSKNNHRRWNQKLRTC